MATMANFSPRHWGGATITDLPHSRSIWRRAESNLESELSGNDMFEISRSRALRRIASTLDFFSPEFLNGGSSTMLQPASKNSQFHDIYAYNHYITDNDINIPAALRSTNDLNYGHCIDMKISVPSQTVHYIASDDFFDVPQESIISVQQPISRPTLKQKLNMSNSDPTTTTSVVNHIEFPTTANITNNLFTLYEEELRKQPPRLKKGYTEPLPGPVVKHEWPALRHPPRLASEDRRRIHHTREEHEAATRMGFEDTLFPDGLVAFDNLNLQSKAERDATSASPDRVQFCLTSPLPTTRMTSSLQIIPMPGKQLIEDLQENEYNFNYVERSRELSHSDESYSLYGFTDQGPANPSAHQSHDKDGRRRKGFKRGDRALQVAICEDWAVMMNTINGPIDIIPGVNRYYVIKSNCELDVFASFKHGIWTSTDLGNQRLDKAFRDPNRRGPIYLFFSITSTGKFCGVAEMTSAVDLSAHAGCWSDKRWRGRFNVHWKIVKDVLNNDLRHFRVKSNDNKPFTNCRDTQEIVPEVGDQILRTFCNYTTSTSLLESAYPVSKYSAFQEHYLG